MELQRNIEIRMYAIMAGLGLLPVLVALKLLGIFVSDRAELSAQGERQASTMVEVPAMRGSIYDRQGRELVVNTANYNLALDPTVDGYTSSVEEKLLDNLSVLTGRPKNYFRQKVEGRTSPKYVLLWSGLGEAEKQVVDEWDVPGLLLVRTLARRYNYGRTAAHVVGHLSTDGHGIDGVELQYEEFLQGIPGERAVQRDRNGEIKAYVAGHTVEPKDGQNLYLTIDLELQAILEDELMAGVAATGSAWGTAIAMDPHTGAILGMANVPNYDPNEYYRSDVSARRNRAIADQVEPGSTFKIVAATAAVEQGVVTMEDSLETGNGYAVIGRRGMHDLHAYGTISFAQAISKSSNIGVARTAVKLDRGVFYQYARNFGFGQKTWIDLPGEVNGTLKKPKDWTGASQASMSIGYEVDVTPLQVLTAYSALANGGLLMKPYVVSERVDQRGRVLWESRPDSIRRVMKRETAAKLLPAFVDVVESGSAKLAKVEGLSIAGKTGTARVIVDGAYDKSMHRATFVGFFPAENPAVAVIVMLARPSVEGNSGAITTPIFKRLALRWISASPEILSPEGASEILAESKPRSIPQIAGQPVNVAAARLRAAGYEVRTSAPIQAFHAAVQPADEDVVFDKRIVLETAPPDTVAVTHMPDLTGLSTRQAVFWSHAAGIDVKIEGQGMVVSQTPGPGEPLTATAVLRCR